MLRNLFPFTLFAIVIFAKSVARDVLWDVENSANDGTDILAAECLSETSKKPSLDESTQKTSLFRRETSCQLSNPVLNRPKNKPETKETETSPCKTPYVEHLSCGGPFVQINADENSVLNCVPGESML